jgi:hypothetical protein
LLKLIAKHPLCCFAFPSLQSGSFAKIAHRAISLRSALPEGEKIEERIYINIDLDEHFPPWGELKGGQILFRKDY